MSNTKKNRKKTRTRRTIKPVAALYEDGNTTVLVKDKDAKGVLRPLTQEEKDRHYPELDADSPEKVAKRLGLYEDDVVRLDDEQSKKKAKSNKNLNRVRQFLALPSAFSNPIAGFAVLFAALIAQFTTFLPKAASTIRAIYFEDDAMLNATIIILNGINGATEYKTDEFRIRRPAFLQGARVSARSTDYSTSPITYFGGAFKCWDGEKLEFWLPLWRRAVAVADNLPETVRALLTGWTSVLPIYFGIKAPKGIDSLSFGGNEAPVDDQALKKAEQGTGIMSVLFGKFARSMYAHPNRGRAVFDHMDEYLPSDRTKGGGTVIPSDEQKFYAAGLCIYGTFLDYLVDKKWLSMDEARELLVTARDAVLPQAAVKGASISAHLAGDWSDRDVFMSFLPSYLKDNAARISFDRTPCEAEIVAAVYEKDGKEILVAPYKGVLDAYTGFLAEFGEQAGWTSVAAFHRAAQAWGIDGFQTGSRDDDPWRHGFYKKDVSNILNCLGIPVSELSEEIRAVIEQVKTARSGNKEVC